MASTLWTAPNVAQDARLPLRARRVFEEIDAAAVANIPLRTKEKVIGQMLILRTIPGPFPEADVRLYEILSDQAAVALERARLLEMSRRQADEEAVLRAVGDRLARAVDLETLMQTTADELSRVLQTSGVYFELGPGPDTRENSSSVEVLGG
jgi:GAF domain-containing protein